MEEDLMKFDGLDDAILGVACRAGGDQFFVYSRDVCIKLLMAQSDMTFEDAEEYFEFNVACAWIGDTTPAFLE